MALFCLLIMMETGLENTGIAQSTPKSISLKRQGLEIHPVLSYTNQYEALFSFFIGTLQ